MTMHAAHLRAPGRQSLGRMLALLWVGFFEVLEDVDII